MNKPIRDTQNKTIRFSQKIKNNLLFQVFRELDSLKGQHRMQIFIAHGFLELLINAIVRAKAKNGKKITANAMSYPYSAQLLILHEIGELSDEEYALYNWFRKLRNKAAHEPIFKITENELKGISTIEYRDINKFQSLCADLMLRLWNKNADILVPIFIPTLVSQKQP